MRNPTEEIIAKHFKKVIRNIIIINAIIAVITVSAMAFIKGDPYSKAIVTQQEGLYIFTNCMPVCGYKTVGKWEIKASSNKAALMLTIMECKKDFPEAEGIIFTSINMDKADFIRFK